MTLHATLTDQIVADVLEGAPALLTYKQAGKLLGRSQRTVRRDVSLGLLQVVRPAGGHPRIPRLVVEHLIREGMQR